MSGEQGHGQEPGSSHAELSGTSRDVVQAGHVDGGIHFHGGSRAPGHGAARPRQLPHDTRHFVNRTAELGQLDDLLGPGRDTPSAEASVCVVAGTPGAGKTSLALRWAHRARDRFPDGQLYINLHGYDPQEPVTAQQALHGFLLGLGVPSGSVPSGAEEAAGLYRSLLAGRRLLVVLDNAATESQVRPQLPGSPGCPVLVTSRGRLSGLAVRDGAQRITLGVLPEGEAVSLLRAVTAGYRTEESPEHWAELAGLCARLPLALRVAAERAATHPHTSLHELVADLRDESALWNALSTGDDAEAEAVRTVFAWSYRALPPEAARLFRLLGLHPGPEFATGAAAALAEDTERHVRQTLDVLVGAHLLEQKGPDRYGFHDLLRAYATDLAREEEEPEHCSAALRRLLDWYLHTALAARELLSPGREPVGAGPPADGVTPVSFSDYDAAVGWVEREQANFPPVVRAAERSGCDRHARLLAEVLFDARAPSAPKTEWIGVAEAGLSSSRRAGDRSGEATLLHYLGFAHRSLNALDRSIACHEQALAIRRELGDRWGETDVLNALGLVHLERRQLDRAEARFDEAMQLFRQLGDQQSVDLTLSNRAGARHDAGRTREAADDMEQALAGHRAHGDKAYLGDALCATSLIRLELGDHEAAHALASEAVDLALELRDHTLEGYWLLALGAAQRAEGEHAGALASYHRSALLHRRLGNRNREALAWRGTGETYTAMHRTDDAVDFLRRAAAVHAELGDSWNEALALAAWAAAREQDDGRPDGTTAGELRQRAVSLLSAFTDGRAVRLRGRLARGRT